MKKTGRIIDALDVAEEVDDAARKVIIEQM